MDHCLEENCCEEKNNLVFENLLQNAASKCYSGFIELRSNSLQATPTHFRPLQATPIHFRPLQATPTYSRLLQATPTHFLKFLSNP